MDRLALAQLGYEGISREIECALNEETSDRTEAWLCNEICPVVQELIGVSSFKQTALWPIRHLVADSREIERRQVGHIHRHGIDANGLGSRPGGTGEEGVTEAGEEGHGLGLCCWRKRS